MKQFENNMDPPAVSEKWPNNGKTGVWQETDKGQWR